MKVQQQAIEKLRERVEYNPKSGYAEIRVTNDDYILSIWGNDIIVYTGLGDFFISDGGYGTSQLTGKYLRQLGANVKFKKGQWYLNTKPWDGKWTKL